MVNAIYMLSYEPQAAKRVHEQYTYRIRTAHTNAINPYKTKEFIGIEKNDVGILTHFFGIHDP